MPRHVPKRSKRVRNTAILAGFVLLLVWLTFFDSHSLYRRVTWHYEAAELAAENETLRYQIESFEQSIQSGLSARDVERIAREQYGMRMKGETVYPETNEESDQP